MHAYAIDSQERRTVPLCLALLAVGAALGTSHFLAALRWTVPWWLDAPSTMAFYGFFYTAFDRWLWRLTPLRWTGLVRAPLVRGAWRGFVTSSFDQHATKKDVDVLIEQTWTRMGIQLRSAESRSESLAATLVTDRPGESVLSYQYRNEPLADSKDTMHVHAGSARLYLTDNDVLDGDYYSGRGRETVGRIHLERIHAATSHRAI